MLPSEKRGEINNLAVKIPENRFFKILYYNIDLCLGLHIIRTPAPFPRSFPVTSGILNPTGIKYTANTKAALFTSDQRTFTAAVGPSFRSGCDEVRNRPPGRVKSSIQILLGGTLFPGRLGGICLSQKGASNSGVSAALSPPPTSTFAA